MLDLQTATKAAIHAEYVRLGGKKAISSFNTKDKLISALAEVTPPPPAPKAEKVEKAAPAPKAVGVRKPSISGRCCELIRKGLDNGAVWATVKKEFNLDDSKKHYPAWNRAMLLRKGEI